MASTVLSPTAQKLATILSGLGVSPTVKGYKWAPADLDSLPAGVVEIPVIERIEPDEAESQLGTTDWHIDYPVSLYFDLGEVIYSQGEAVEVVEAWIKAVDADNTLSGSVLDARVVSAEPSYLKDESRVLIVYETHVHVFQLV